MRFVVEFEAETSTWTVTQFDNDNLPVVEFFGLSFSEVVQALSDLAHEFVQV